MVSVPKLLKGVKSVFHSGTTQNAATQPIKNEAQTLLSFGSKANGTTSAINETGVVPYRIKPDITMPIHPETLHTNNPIFEIKANLLKAKDESQLGQLGNISLRLAQKYKAAEEQAAKEIREVFEGFDVSVRSKGANSVYSKLERMLIKGNKNIKTDEEARLIIQDAIGGRIQLKDLTSKDVIDTINTIKVDGKSLSKTEKTLVQRLFNNEKLTAEELEIANRFAKPIKLALAEKQSEPVVKKFMVAGIKDALNRKVTTLEKLEQSGIKKDYLDEIKTNPNVKPLRMTEINNYKGLDGVSYFSDRQIKEFEKLQLATGEKFDIITCSESIDLAKYGLEGLSKSAKDAIKKSGYTTGQINVVLKDGTLGEIQVRGTGPFGEYEHIAYDANQGKNTLSKVFDKYVNAVKKLSKDDFDDYNQNYISRCYDYYRNRELGIKSPKPELNKRFDSILSEDNMKYLHDLDCTQQAEKMKTFVPHIEVQTSCKTFLG